MAIIMKRLEDITRKEWVSYRWVEIPPTMDDSGDERVFRTNGRRTPDEAYSALEEWEVTAEDRDCELDKKGNIQ